MKMFDHSNITMSEVITKLQSWDPNYNIPLHGHTGPVWSVCSTSNNSHIFSGSEDQKIIVWDFLTQQPISTLIGHKGTVNALEISPDDETLISGGWDNAIIIWNWKDSKKIGELVGHTGGVYCFILANNGQTLISGSGDGSAKVWNIAQRTNTAVLNNVGNSVFCMALQSDEAILVTGGWNGAIRVWDFVNFTEKGVYDDNGENHVIQSMAMTPNMKFLVFGKRNNEVKVWAWPARTVHFVYRTHNNWVRNIVTTKDNVYFISASADKSIRMVNIEEKIEEFNFEANDGYVFGLNLSKDGTILYSGASDKIVRVRTIGTLKNVKNFKGHARCIMCVAISPDSRFVVSSAEDRSVRKWDIQSGVQLAISSIHTDTVWAVCISSDMTKVLSVSGDMKLIVLDFEFNLLATLSEHRNPIFCVACSMNCNIAATGAQDKNVILWDIMGYTKIKVLEGHTDTVFTVKFAENDEKLVSGSADYTMRIWSTANLTQLAKLNTKCGMIESISISPNHKFVAIADRKNQVCLWNWQNLSFVTKFSDHKKWVKCVNFSNDSKTFASCSNDLTIRLWDAEQLVSDLLITGHKNTIRSVCFSEDNGFLVSGSEDLSVNVWDLKNCDIMDVADFVDIFDAFLFKKDVVEKRLPRGKWCQLSFSPLKVNLLHIYSYLNYSELLKLGIDSGIEIKRDRSGNTPLHYAIERYSQECVDVILHHLCKLSKTKHRKFITNLFRIEKDFSNLLRNSSKYLPEFLTVIFIRISDNSVPKLAIPQGPLPIYAFSESPVIKEFQFIKPEPDVNSSHSHELVFRVLTFLTPTEFGSKSSMDLMKNMISCRNSKIFETEVIQGLIDIKWSQISLFSTIELSMKFLVAYLSAFTVQGYEKIVLAMNLIIFAMCLNKISMMFRINPYISKSFYINLITSAGILIGFALSGYIGMRIIVFLSMVRAAGGLFIIKQFQKIIIVLQQTIHEIMPIAVLINTFAIGVMPDLLNDSFSEHGSYTSRYFNIAQGNAVIFFWVFMCKLTVMLMKSDEEADYMIKVYQEKAKIVYENEVSRGKNSQDKGLAFLHGCFESKITSNSPEDPKTPPETIKKSDFDWIKHDLKLIKDQIQLIKPSDSPA